MKGKKEKRETVKTKITKTKGMFCMKRMLWKTKDC